MAERWVVNASPLILLSKIEHQHLLSQLANEVVVPDAVSKEIEAGPHDDAARLFLSTALQTVVPVTNDPTVLAWDLGAGETAVLSFARQNPGWRAVIDDGAARRCATAMGVPIIGTLGIILRARKANLIPNAGTPLRLLLQHGFRLDDTVIRKALWETVGEVW